MVAERARTARGARARVGRAVATRRRPPDGGAARRAPRTEGLDLLGWSRDDRDLQARLQLLHRTLGDPWPDVATRRCSTISTHASRRSSTAARRRADLARLDARAPCCSPVAPPTAARDLDRLAPTHLAVRPGNRSGSLRSVPAGGPSWRSSSRSCSARPARPPSSTGRVPVLIHLLSPAGRPVQVTDDLPSFWATGYPQVRAELRGRYPKHPWPEDPTTAVADRPDDRGASAAGAREVAARQRSTTSTAAARHSSTTCVKPAGPPV